MQSYTDLIKALRHCMTKEDGITICELCPYYGKGIECENVLHTDAAAAIEELDAEETRLLLLTSDLQDKLMDLQEQLNDADVAAEDDRRQIEELQAEVKRLELDNEDYEHEHRRLKGEIEALQAEQKKTVTQIFGEEQMAWEGRCKDLMKQISELQAEVKILKVSGREAYFEGMAAEAEPNLSKWVRVEDEESYHYECSRCGERPLYSRYGNVVLSGVCPMCGAKMNDSNASNALNALDNAQDGPIITPCRGCSDYDGYGGCKSKGGCARAKMEVQE